MGMYDTIYCEYPLPKPRDNCAQWVEERTKDYQTKDLTLSLAKYKISKAGRLYKLTRKTNEWIPQTINQVVYMLDVQQNQDLPFDYTIEYRLVFENGFVTNAKLFRFKISDNTYRKELENKILTINNE